MKKIIVIFITLLVLSVVAGIIMIPGYSDQSFRHNPLPVLGKVSDFSLINSRSEEVTLHNLKDKVWIVDFIFTTCAGPCPIMSNQMASLHRSYKREDNVRFVSITVDPEYDSPPVMAEYAARYGADTDHWYFLTGVRENIHALAVGGFKIGSIEEPVFHSTKIVLVDKQARIRGYYEGTDENEVVVLFRDIASLLREQSS